MPTLWMDFRLPPFIISIFRIFEIRNEYFNISLEIKYLWYFSNCKTQDATFVLCAILWNLICNFLLILLDWIFYSVLTYNWPIQRYNKNNKKIQLLRKTPIGWFRNEKNNYKTVFWFFDFQRWVFLEGFGRKMRKERRKSHSF